MKTYDLYVESGPMKRTTMVHVPALAGCIARGETTDAALEATPEAIRAYVRFLAHHGERLAAKAAFTTRVVEHQTEGQWLGNGSIFIETDLEPLSAREAEAMLARLGRIHAGLRDLTSGMTAKQLDESPKAGRPIRRILEHVVGAEGGYLREVTGASRLAREVRERLVDPARRTRPPAGDGDGAREGDERERALQDGDARPGALDGALRPAPHARTRLGALRRDRRAHRSRPVRALDDSSDGRAIVLAR